MVTYDVIEVAQSKAHAVSPDDSVWCTDPHLPTQGMVAVIDPPLAQSAVPLEVPVRLARVEVRDAGTDTLETAIEILSPLINALDANAMGAQENQQIQNSTS